MAMCSFCSVFSSYRHVYSMWHKAFAPAIVGMSGQIHADFLRLFWVLTDKQMLSYFESKEDKIGNLRDVNGRNPCKLHRRAMPVSIFAALECVPQCKSFFLQFSLLRVQKISGSSTDYTGIFRISCLCVIWVGRWATCKMHYTYTEFAGPSEVHHSNAYEQRCH